MTAETTRRDTRHQSTLLEIKDQCRDTALTLSFSISKLKEIDQSAAARRLQDASIILSAVADDLGSVLNGGRRHD